MRRGFVLPLLTLAHFCVDGVCGAALGVAGMYTMPDFPARDVMSAAAVGIVSGLAATGADQIGKQMKKE